jgi:hypothetical protein
VKYLTELKILKHDNKSCECTRDNVTKSSKEDRNMGSGEFQLGIAIAVTISGAFSWLTGML